jgi:hypothetical protein
MGKLWHTVRQDLQARGCAVSPDSIEDPHLLNNRFDYRA